MTQRHFIQNERTLLVTTNVLNRRKVFTNPTYAREAVECLYRVQQLHPFFLYAFVIMPDHCHFLVYIPAPNTISRIMNSYKSGLTFDLGIPKLWQKRFHIREIDHPAGAKQYLHLNLVHAGLAETEEAYPWSSACGNWDISPILG